MATSEICVPLAYPYPLGYDQNVRCEFHDGSSGNTIRDCIAFKYKIKELIDKKTLDFKIDGPKVNILFSKPSKKHNTLMFIFCKEHN